LCCKNLKKIRFLRIQKIICVVNHQTCLFSVQCHRAHALRKVETTDAVNHKLQSECATVRIRRHVLGTQSFEGFCEDQLTYLKNVGRTSLKNWTITEIDLTETAFNLFDDCTIKCYEMTRDNIRIIQEGVLLSNLGARRNYWVQHSGARQLSFF